METGFSFTLDELQGINRLAPSDHDSKLAQKAVSEMELFAQERMVNINDFVQLRKVITNSEAIAIRDELTALRHLCGAIFSLSEDFRQSKVGVFAPAREKIKKITSEADSAVQKLLEYTKEPIV